jgi:hypothetical protein
VIAGDVRSHESVLLGASSYRGGIDARQSSESKESPRRLSSIIRGGRRGGTGGTGGKSRSRHAVFSG